jgi:hypothetical protein
VLVLDDRDAAPRIAELIEPLVAAGRQVIALDDPTEATAARSSRITEFAAAIEEAAAELHGLDALIAHGLGSAAAARALEQGLHVEHALLYA